MEPLTKIDSRKKCYQCYRPLSSCMCSYITPLQTNTKFVILMHPKEFKKTKNGTGHLTHLSLPNSCLYVDVDFSGHRIINSLIDDHNNLCFVLYPGKKSININTQKIELNGKQMVIFIIDSTWPCSLKMLRLSNNINQLPRLSFTHTRISEFKIKEQPKEYCLSTIESTQILLELLDQQGVESFTTDELSAFLNPFHAMVTYQLECALNATETVRFIKRDYSTLSRPKYL